MRPVPSRCPFCQSELEIVRVHCPSCDSGFDGRFSLGGLAGLSKEQLEFINIFVRCEGKIKRVEQEMGLSYPTVRNRLREVIRTMGFEPEAEEGLEVIAEKRRSILSDLEDGRISAEAASRSLRELSE
jgi:hypothetical protein